MDLDQASMFLSGSILVMSGFIVIVTGVILINNLVARYWKSWGWQFCHWAQLRPESDFVTHQELPHLMQQYLRNGNTTDQALDHQTR